MGKRKVLAVIMTLCLLVMVMPGKAVVAGDNDVTAEMYPTGEDVAHDFEARGELYGDVLIPDGCSFIALNNMTIQKVTIKAGGALMVGADYSSEEPAFYNMTMSDLVVENGSMIIVAGPCDVKVGDTDVPLNDLDGTTTFAKNDYDWTVFAYDGTNWCRQLNYDFSVWIDGAIDTEVSVSYSFDNSTWVDVPALPAGEEEDEENRNNYEFSFGIGAVIEENEIPFDETTPFYVKVEVKSIKEGREADKVFANASLGLDKDEYDNFIFDLHNDTNATISSDNHTETLNYKFTSIDGVPHDFHLDLAYKNQGDEGTGAMISDHLWAYSDLDGVNGVNEDDMEIGLSAELCSKYFWANGGVLCETFGIFKCDDLQPRITVTPAGTTSAKKADGTTATISKFEYVIALGSNPDGMLEKAEGIVYGLPNNHCVLISTGTELYIRDTGIHDTGAGETDGDYIAFDLNNEDMAISVTAEFDNEKLQINGNGAGSTETINPAGDDIFCVFLSNYTPYDENDPIEKGTGFLNVLARDYTTISVQKADEITGKIRIMKPSKTYISINGEGETKYVSGINSDTVDNICQTGSEDEEKIAEVFVGYNKLHINPLAAGTGVANTSIKDIKLADESMSDGVTVKKNSTDDFEVEFKSNFYDNVPIKVVYGDDSEKVVNIHRVGLVITTQYLMDQGPGVQHANLFHSGDETNIDYSYNYNEGEQLLVLATYYHPSSDTASGSDNLKLFLTRDDGSIEIVNAYKYTPATSTDVATTDFIIDLTAVAEWDGYVWITPNGIGEKNIGAFHAFVVTADYNSKDNFGGTKLGSGTGVYFDGDVTWNFN